MEESVLSRKQIAYRLLITFLFVIIISLTLTFLKLAVIFQYIVLFINKKPNENIRVITNKVCTYNYKIMRYMVLNENKQPYPFNEFPAEMENSEDKVVF